MNKAFKNIFLILLIAADCFLLRYAVIQYENIKYFKGDCFRYPPANNAIEAWERYHKGEISGKNLRSMLYKNDNRILICPFCRHDVVPIRYGLRDFAKDSLDYDIQGRVRVVYGGRVMDASFLACTQCNRYYRRLKPLLLDWQHERERLKTRII